MASSNDSQVQRGTSHGRTTKKVKKTMKKSSWIQQLTEMEDTTKRVKGCTEENAIVLSSGSSTSSSTLCQNEEVGDELLESGKIKREEETRKKDDDSYSSLSSSSSRSSDSSDDSTVDSESTAYTITSNQSNTGRDDNVAMGSNRKRSMRKHGKQSDPDKQWTSSPARTKYHRNQTRSMDRLERDNDSENGYGLRQRGSLKLEDQHTEKYPTVDSTDSSDGGSMK